MYGKFTELTNASERREGHISGHLFSPSSHSVEEKEEGRKVKVSRPSERRSALPIAASTVVEEAEREVTDAGLPPSLADVGVVKRKKETCLVECRLQCSIPWPMPLGAQAAYEPRH